MSFILDGLKKIEENRHKDSIPNLLTIHSPEFQKTKKRPVWPYFIVAALLLNALLISIWLRIWAPEEAAVKQTAVKKEGEIISRKQPATDLTTVNAVYTLEQEVIKTENIIPNDKRPLKTPETSRIENKEYNKDIGIIKASSHSTSLYEQKVTDDSNSPVETSDKVVELGELPLNIRQALPDISISAHIYSNNPSSRLVNINGNIVHEGETVTPELEVDEITMNGVILKYKGYRFSMRGL